MSFLFQALVTGVLCAVGDLLFFRWGRRLGEKDAYVRGKLDGWRQAHERILGMDFKTPFPPSPNVPK